MAALGTAAAGREARAALEASGFNYDAQFAAAGLALFEGVWGWLGKVGGPALDAGPYGQIDDDVSDSHFTIVTHAESGLQWLRRQV